MTGRLNGKVALVTGGSRGIGAAIAHRFATEGAHVAITYVGNHAAAEATVEGLKKLGVPALAIKANAGSSEEVKQAVAKVAGTLGTIDILVHSAGVAEFVDVTTTEGALYEDAERRHFAVNVSGVSTLTKAALARFRDGGRIIVIGSVNAHQMPFPGTAIYGASKAAVAALARGWARDLGPRNILVNVIQPGPIDTDMNPDDERDAVKVMTAMTALKRYGKPQEIAALAAFLASDESSYITGATIDVDGGFSI